MALASRGSPNVSPVCATCPYTCKHPQTLFSSETVLLDSLFSAPRKGETLARSHSTRKKPLSLSVASLLPLCVPASWSQHPDMKTTFAVVSYVLKSLPWCGVIENVHGMKTLSRGMDRSPLQVIQADLEQGGYATGVLELDLSLWQACVRKRCAPQFPQSRVQWKPCVNHKPRRLLSGANSEARSLEVAMLRVYV